MTNKKKTFTKHLLAGASVAALSVFVGQGAFATAITAGASTSTDLTGPTADLTLTGVHTNGTTPSAAHVLIGADSNTFTLTTGAYAHTVTDAADANGDWLRTSANTSMNLVVSAGGSIKSNGNSTENVLDINHNFGTITNKGTLQMTAGTGKTVVDIAGVTVAGIENSGTISANTTGIALSIATGATITKGIVNSGTITATTTGTAIKVAGTLTADGESTGVVLKNTGTISAIGSSAGALDIDGVVTGIINNASGGTISDTTGTAVNIGANVTGGFTNAGTISATSGQAVRVSASVSSTEGINNSGTISATTGTAFEVTSGTLVLLTNSGTIQSTAGKAIDTNTGVITTLTNESTGTIKDTTSGVGIDLGAAITALNNKGTISTATGSAVNVTADITSTITNTGVIKASSTGMAVNLDNDLTALINTGMLSGTLTSVSLSTAKAGDEGVIYAASTGAAIDIASGVTTEITNTKGLIYSEGAAAITAVSNSGTAVTITNSGIIASDAAVGTIDFTGTAVVGTSDITNSGLIVNSSATGYAIRSTSTTSTGLASTITNETGGVIKGAGTSVINIAELNGGIVNKGTITATLADAEAIFLSSDSDITGDIDNQGTITTTGTAGAAIDLSASTSQAITVTNSGTITGAVKLASGGTYTQTAGSVSNGSGNTTLLGNGGAETINLYGGTITGNIDMGSDNSDAINFGNADGDTIAVAGTINFDDMTAAFGTTTLSGKATGVNAATSTVTVDEGATLYLDADMVNSGVRDISGTLHIAAGKEMSGTGAVTINDGGILEIDVVSATSYGKVTGAALTTTGDITVNTSGITGYIADNTTLSKVYDGSAALSGFTDEATLADDSYIYKFTQVANGANDVDIVVTREHGFGDASMEGNISGVGAVLETIGDDGDDGLDSISGLLGSMTSASEVASALKTLTPDVSGAATTAAVATSNVSIGTVEGRMEVARAEMDGQGVAAGSASLQNGAWGQVFGQKQDQDTKDGVNGYQADTAGFALGFETGLNDQTRAGLSFSYGKTDADSANASTDIDSYQASLYGTYAMDKWYTEAVASYTYNDYNSKRTLFNGSVADADYNGNQYDVRGTFGYNLGETGGIKITPFAGLAYTYLDTDEYTETGSDANLHVDNNEINILKSDLGAKFDYPMSSNGVTYNPHVLVAWDYDFIGDETKTTSNFSSAAGVTFESKGADVARNSIRLGAGLDVMTQDNLTVSLDYDYEGRTKFDSHAGTIKARFGF